MSKASSFSAVALVLTLSLSPTSADEVSFEDLIALLKAGVGESIILRHVALSDAAFEIGVQEILELKKAGAPDSLIEALMPPSEEAGREEAPPAEPVVSEEAPFRIFKETTEDGREVLHITNLDRSGRPMGSSASRSEPVPPNRYRSRESVEEYAGEPGVRSHEITAQGGGLENRVVVTLLPPAPPPDPEVRIVPVAAEPYTSPYMHRDPYASLYPGGILPGYHYAGCGYACGTRHYHRARLSPPGSYTHYVRYHDGHARLLHAPWQQRYYSRHLARRPAFVFPGPAQGRAALRYLRDQVRVDR